jgi:hypothetical protein
MTAPDRRAVILRAIRGVPLWMWPVWAGAGVVVAGLISLMFFTSAVGPRAIIVNDTAARLHVFYCADDACIWGGRDLRRGHRARRGDTGLLGLAR